MAIRQGLGSRPLPCGCVAGLYETYDTRTVALIDVRDAACKNPAHGTNAEIDLTIPTSDSRPSDSK